MPIACPACQRRNSERLTACLYCGEELPLSGSAGPGAAEAAPNSEGLGAEDRTAELARVSLLVLAPAPLGADGRAPPSRLDPRRLEVVSRVLDLDPYLARRALVTCYPKVIARGEAGCLRGLAGELAKAGLSLSIVAPEALDSMGEALAATSLELPASGGVVLVGPRGREPILPGTVKLMLQAEIRVQWVGPRREAPGRPSFRESSPSADDLDQVRSNYPVLEIQREREARVRLHLAEFDFSGLGPRARPSALLNLLGLVRLLREDNPDAVFDEGFRFVPPESDPVDGVFGAFGSNEAQFDHYACVVGAHWAQVRAGQVIHA